MENKRIYELMKKFECSCLDTIEVNDGDFSVKMTKNTNIPTQNYVVMTENNVQQNTNIEPTVQISGKTIKSPIVGTFYATSSPDKPPFVTVGMKVAKGDVVCIVEAMKMFNEVISEHDGIVKEILVSSGDNIEYGQPLIILE